jgi:hypothetical protein
VAFFDPWRPLGAEAISATVRGSAVDFLVARAVSLQAGLQYAVIGPLRWFAPPFE